MTDKPKDVLQVAVSNGLWGSQYPWYIRVIFVLGFPSAVAIYLLALQTGFLESPITRSLDARAKEHQEISLEVRKARWQNMTLLRLICENGSRDEAGRRECRMVVAPPPDGGPR